MRVDISLGTTENAQPPKGYYWILIGGVVYHFTGTLSILAIRTVPSSETVVSILLDPRNLSLINIISDAEPTGNLPIFSTVAEYYHTRAFPPMPILDNHRVWFFGAANAVIHPIFLEVKQ